MYAVVQDRKRQIRVESDQTLELAYNAGWEPKSEIVLDQVCVVGDPEAGSEARIGAPFVEGVRVVLECLGHDKGDKIVIGKFKRRKNYRRKNGFRPLYTRVKVKAIEG